MATLYQGLKLWPGGSLVEGNITDGGASATGSVADWAPTFPYSSAGQPSADSTFISTQPDGKSWDAIGIMAAISGTASDVEYTLALNIWMALLFPVLNGTGITASYYPMLVQLTWASGEATMPTWADDVGPFPNGSRILNGPTSDIAETFRPLAFPRNNVPADGSNIASNGYARDSVVSAQTDNVFVGLYTIPLCGAVGALYRVNTLTIADADMDDIDLRLGYTLIRSNL